jgi:hypothetical protein
VKKLVIPILVMLLLAACTVAAGQAVPLSLIQSHTFEVLSDANDVVGSMADEAGQGVALRSTSVVAGNHARLILAADSHVLPITLSLTGGGLGDIEATKGAQTILTINHSRFCAVECGLKWDEAEGASYRNVVGDVVVNGHRAADPDWVAASLAGGWANYGGGYATAAYRLSAVGEVALQGSVVFAAQSKVMPMTAALVLPAKYWPSGIVSFAVDGGRVEVWPDGRVFVTGVGRVSLDGVRFYAAGN